MTDEPEWMIIPKDKIIELFDKAGDGLALWCSLRFYSRPVPKCTDVECDKLKATLNEAMETLRDSHQVLKDTEGLRKAEHGRMEDAEHKLKLLKDRIGIKRFDATNVLWPELERLKKDLAQSQEMFKDQTSELERLKAKIERLRNTKYGLSGDCDECDAVDELEEILEVGPPRKLLALCPECAAKKKGSGCR